jgi:hypothetical protein
LAWSQAAAFSGQPWLNATGCPDHHPCPGFSAIAGGDVPMGGALLIVAGDEQTGALTIAALPYGIFIASANFTYQPAGIEEPVRTARHYCH